MKLKYDFVIQEVGTDYFAVANGESTKEFSNLIKLNSVGKDIFEKLKEDTTIEEVIKFIKDKYDGDDEMIEKSVRSFIDNLSKQNLLTE